MQDPRYKKLRQSLDLMKLPQHLNPDSIDLVQKLLNQYTRLLDIYNKLKKKSTLQQSKIDISHYQHQIDLLNQKYGQLKEQNEKLKKRSEQNVIEQKIITLETSLQNCRIKYQKKLDQLNQKINNYQFQISEINVVKNSLYDENQRIRLMFQKSKNDSQNIANQLSMLLEKKKKQIQKLEQQNSKYRLQITTLQRIHTQQKHSQSTPQLQSSTKQTLTIHHLKQQIQQLQQKLQSTNKQLEQEHQINKQLQYTIKNQIDKLNLLKQQEDYIKSAKNIQIIAKQKYQQMYMHSQGKVQELMEKLGVLERVRGEQDGVVQGLRDQVRDVRAKNQTLMANMNKMQEELGVLNGKYTGKLRELRQAENFKVGMQRKIKDLQMQIKQYQQRGIQRKQLGFLDTHTHNLHQQSQKTKLILQKQLQLLQNQLKINQQSSHKTLSQKSRLQTQIKKLHLILQQSTKQCQLLQLQKQTLLKQSKQLKQSLSSTQSSNSTTRQQLLRLTQTISQYQILLQQQKSQLQSQQHTSKCLLSKLAEHEKTIQQQHQSNKQIYQDNKQLKIMVVSLQKIKADLFEKYKHSNQQKINKDQNTIQYIKQYNRLLDENRCLLEKLRKKQCDILEISNQYDLLQNVVDRKTEENVRLLEDIKRLQKQLTSYDRGLGQSQQNLQTQQTHIHNLQHQLHTLQTTLTQKSNQLLQYQQSLNTSTLTCQTLNNQLTLLIKSSKQSQKCLQYEKSRQSQLQRKYKDKIKQLDQIRQYSSMIKIQNQNLCLQVQKCKQQVCNLENYSNQVVQEYNNLYNVFKGKQVEMREMEEGMQVMRFKESQYLSQIGHYEKQLRVLGQDMAKKDEEIRRLVNDRDVYRAEVNTSRRNYNATNSTDWKIIYQDKITTLQNEIHLKKRQCESYRTQLKKYQKIIQNERQKNFILQQQLRKSKINDSSQTPIKMFYKSRVQSQNWNGYNRDLTDSQRNSEYSHDYQYQYHDNDKDKEIKSNNGKNKDQIFLKRSNVVGESFQSQKVSVSSKQFLDNLTRQYNKTNVNKDKR